jgi:outer membrane protein assembly factor BamB
VIGRQGQIHVVSGNRMDKLSSDLGTKLWSFTLANSITSTPVIGADGTVSIGQGGVVRAVDGMTGRLRWET